jgi:polysaccharide export outer membrane protein
MKCLVPRVAILLALCWTAPVWAAHQVPVPQSAAPQPTTAAAADYLIGAQDVLSINVHEDDALRGRYTVEADGTFSFPLIGRIKAGGLTIREFEASLKARLKDGFFVNPQVTVGIEQYRSQRVFVTGEVRSPGMISLTGGMTLVEALARAGGVIATSSAGDVAIVRDKTKRPNRDAPDDDDAEPIRVSLRELESGRSDSNVALLDGDTIYVLRAESLYVFGEVKSPGAVSVQPGMTVLQALALVGGATVDAALNRIKIVRVENGERKEIKAKLTDLVKAGDTIIVPERYFELE